MKTFVIFLLGIALGLPTNAQQKEHRLTLHHGFLSVEEINFGCRQVFNDIFSEVFNSEHKELNFTGPIGISYIQKENRFAYGSSFYFSRAKVTGDDYYLKANYFSYFYDIEYFFVNNPSFKMYLGVSLGLTFEKEKELDLSRSNRYRTDNKIKLAYQFNPIAFQIGKTFTASISTGIGRKGILNLGLGYQF